MGELLDPRSLAYLQEFLDHTNTAMKILAAICLLAVGASAQVGLSGIISPDGKNIQFSHDQANNIAVAGPSGIVTKDGKNIQLTHGQATLNAAIPAPAAPTPVNLPPTLAAGVVGASGIVHPAGNTQFTREQAENIILIGPSGIVTRDGRNIQLRSKLTPDQYTRAIVVGPSGAVALDGKNIQFAAPAGVTVLLDGPSGTVMSDGTLVQKRAKRALIGPSGMIRADGTPVQFTQAEGEVRATLTDEQNAKAVVVGPSGIVNVDGINTQFDAPAAPHVILDGPSGQVMSDGSLVQKVVKRSLPLVGLSGVILADGTPIQLPAGVTIASAGPSGVVLSNGQNIQFS